MSDAAVSPGYPSPQSHLQIKLHPEVVNAEGVSQMGPYAPQRYILPKPAPKSSASEEEGSEDCNLLGCT